MTPADPRSRLGKGGVGVGVGGGGDVFFSI